MSNKPKKVLLLGWDAADWKVINPLMDQGLMPNMQKLVENGTISNLATLDPAYSPMLWSSIATGKRPYKHGVYGFVEPTPDGKDVRPVMSVIRKCKAIWNILTQEHYKTHVVGWWPSHPAEPINGDRAESRRAISCVNTPSRAPWSRPCATPGRLAESTHGRRQPPRFARCTGRRLICAGCLYAVRDAPAHPEFTYKENPHGCHLRCLR